MNLCSIVTLSVSLRGPAVWWVVGLGCWYEEGRWRRREDEKIGEENGGVQFEWLCFEGCIMGCNCLIKIQFYLCLKKIAGCYCCWLGSMDLVVVMEDMLW